MRVYFHSNNKESVTSREILRHMKSAEVDIVARASSDNDLLDKIDVLLVDGENLDTRSGYLIALSLTQNKDVLCLFPQGVKVDHTLETLEGNQKLNKKLAIEFYSKGALKEKIFDFFRTLDQGGVKDLFNIKYTLRISSGIADYLNWKSKQLHMPKADWLREQIKKMIENDEVYQDFIKNKFKID